MTSVLLLESSSKAAMDVTVAHSRLPFASSSRMTRFFESCSWMRMTFSCPFTMKVPSRAVVGAGQVSPLLAGTEEADVMPAGV